tara:strand:- start:111 stop:305 length:195 start_codon:yes stop_codon:yes gene_type:complete
MKILKFFLFFIILFSYFAISSAENNNELTNKISKNIRCLICQGQSIYDSQSDFAVSVKLFIKKK